MATTYPSKSYFERHDTPGEDRSERSSSAEVKIAALEYRIARVAASVPEGNDRTALLRAASTQRTQLASAEQALDSLLALGGTRSFVRQVEEGVHNAETSLHTALVFSTSRHTIRPEPPAMSPRQFTEHAQASLRARGIGNMPSSDLIEQAYAEGKERALEGVRTLAEQAVADLEESLGSPQLVARARRQILDSLVDAYITRVDKKLNEIQKHTHRIRDLGKVALRRQARTNQELVGIKMQTRGIADLRLLGANDLELDFDGGGRKWLEVTGLMLTDAQTTRRLRALANSYPGMLHTVLQGKMDLWVGQAKLRAAYPGMTDRQILMHIRNKNEGGDESAAYREALAILHPPKRPGRSTYQT